MIDEVRTYKKFGYFSRDLKSQSHKLVCVICDDCGKSRWSVFQSYSNLCNSCSQIGKRNHFYGKTHSNKTKQIISENSIGKVLSKETKRKMSNSRLGRIVSEETRQKLREANIGKNNPNYGKYGDKNPNWNPNLTDKERENNRKYPEYIEWRFLVFQRDNYICKICGSNKKINAHHLNSFHDNPDKRIILKNGITLCEKCHKNFHHQYGYGNNTKNQFIRFQVDNPL